MSHYNVHFSHVITFLLCTDVYIWACKCYSVTPCTNSLLRFRSRESLFQLRAYDPHLMLSEREGGGGGRREGGREGGREEGRREGGREGERESSNKPNLHTDREMGQVKYHLNPFGKPAALHVPKRHILSLYSVYLN